MTREQLEHAIRAACRVAEDTEIWVFGSQAILAEFPDAHPDLRASIEVDVQPKNKPENVEAVNGTLGEISRFHETFNFYVHGMEIDGDAFPESWEKRAVRIKEPVDGMIGWCIEKHDLAANKLMANREKDREFVRTLMIYKMIDIQTFTDRIGMLNISEEDRNLMQEWVEITRKAL